MNRKFIPSIVAIAIAAVFVLLLILSLTGVLPSSKNLWVWIAAALTLAIFSILYKENPFYRVAEHLFLGLSVGYSLTFIWHNALWQLALRPLFVGGELILIVPILLGLLYFTRIVPKVSWMVRIPIAIALGWGSGISIPLAFQASIFRQMQAGVEQIAPARFVAGNLFSLTGGIWGIVILLGTLATLMYFFFSRKEKSVLSRVASPVGIFFIMLGFGATFGLTVMSRISLLIGRVQFLLRDWLGIIN